VAQKKVEKKVVEKPKKTPLELANEEVTEQGDRVRELKAKKVAKPEIDAAVAKLLELKKKVKELGGDAGGKEEKKVPKKGEKAVGGGVSKKKKKGKGEEDSEGADDGAAGGDESAAAPSDAAPAGDAAPLAKPAAKGGDKKPKEPKQPKEPKEKPKKEAVEAPAAADSAPAEKKEKSAKKEKAPKVKGEEKPKDDKPKEPKAPKPKHDEEEDPAEAEEAAERKKPAPQDSLPPTSMDFDEWKRTYSNNKARPMALPWLWEKYDPTGYAFWFAEYIDAPKYLYNQLSWQVSNLVGGWFNRLEKMHKYAFGSVCVFGKEKQNTLSAVWLYRGTEFPPQLELVDDTVNFSWRRMDHTNPADKELIEDYFALDGSFGGRIFCEGSIFK